jgi:ribosomal protein L11 methyltransferase
MAQLGELGFESFVEEGKSEELLAYIPQADFKEEAVNELCSALSEMSYEMDFRLIKKENWNKKWEENFDSVKVDDFCYIRAPFHPEGTNVDYEILIEPKMSFGTGHHQTTQLMIRLMKEIDFKGLKVLDMGSGTGILAILAKMMGAIKVDAIDIEEWAYENMQENVERNKVAVNTYLGDAALLERLAEKYDVVIANINKNILMADMPEYMKVLKEKGRILLSGFFYTDDDELLGNHELSTMKLYSKLQEEDWCALALERA